MHELQLKCDNQLEESGISTKILVLDSLFPYLLKMNVPYNCIGITIKDEKGELLHDLIFSNNDEVLCNNTVVGKIEYLKSESGN